MSWTSGKKNRLTVLYRQPVELAERLAKLERPVKQITLNQGIQHYGEAVELKLAGKSVNLPPSNHPETDGYRWLKSPQQIEVAIAPDWVVAAIEAECDRREQVRAVPARDWSSLNSTELDSYIEQALAAIDPDCDHDTWIKVGLALHSAGEQYLEAWDEWSSTGTKYKSGECERRWRSFSSGSGITLGTLFWLAGIKFTSGSDAPQRSDRDRQIAARKLKALDLCPRLAPDFKLTATAKREIEYYSGYAPVFDPTTHRTTLLRGWLGAGKTEAAIRSLAPFKNKQVLWLGPRNGLLANTETRLESAGFEIYHYQDDPALFRRYLETGKPGVYSCCPDSLKLYAVGRVNWLDTIVVIDESAGIRGEILSKSAVLPEFERLLKEAAHVIALDAF